MGEKVRAFTPGPWKLEQAVAVDFAEITVTATDPDTALRVVVARVNRRFRDARGRVHPLGNAPLIVAAPQLLAVCKAAISAVRTQPERFALPDKVMNDLVAVLDKLDP
jgi:hypothetical protein